MFLPKHMPALLLAIVGTTLSTSTKASSPLLATPTPETPASEPSAIEESHSFTPSNETIASLIPWKQPRYTLLARVLSVKEALNTFAVAEGLSIVMSSHVDGVFSGTFKDIPAGDFLNRITTMHNLIWYYDGSTLFIYGAGEIQTLLLDLHYMKAKEVRDMLQDLGVEDSRFPIKTTAKDELILVSGPPRYVTLISELIMRADQLREMRTFNEIETRIYPLTHTWADDVSFTVNSPETSVSIRGVAHLLEELMATTDTSNTQELATPSDAKTTQTPTDTTTKLPDPNRAQANFTPIIRAENRLNAVVVRDIATRQPLYEDLIHQLDTQQQLVEIGITVLELSKDDSLDWQLSLNVTGTQSDITGAIGQNMSNLATPSTLTGHGLAGALTYLGKDFSVSASLNALREKGKARNISRTTLLTLNNMTAALTDTQSYHARVVGTDVATLEEVSAGICLQIKPRIIHHESSEKPDQIWLTMKLQDGGFESVVVDAMPMTRTSTLETQTVVAEGDAILLAGYVRDIDENAQWGIPYLRDIPGLGWLFGGSSSTQSTIQRLFILTPYIITLDTQAPVTVQTNRLRDIQQVSTLSEASELTTKDTTSQPSTAPQSPTPTPDSDVPSIPEDVPAETATPSVPEDIPAETEVETETLQARNSSTPEIAQEELSLPIEKQDEPSEKALEDEADLPALIVAPTPLEVPPTPSLSHELSPSLAESSPEPIALEVINDSLPKEEIVLPAKE